jgi:hypothetical protein
MDKTNIVKLAKILDKFIELESSYVLIEDIKGIKVHVPDNDKDPREPNGIVIITPYGEFYDSADFKELKTRVGDVQEALREQRIPAPVNIQPVVTSVKAPGITVPITTPPTTMSNVAAQVQETLTTNITLTDQGARGFLFDDPKISLINRENAMVFSQSGTQVAKVTTDGRIEGDEGISGVLLNNGKYHIAANKYAGGNQIAIQYQITRK